MQLQFDHLVHYVNSDMRETVRRLQQAGLAGVPGGRHDRFGTYNSLCYFDLSYIEYLGVEDADLCRSLAHDNRFLGQLMEDLPRGEGFGTVALRTDRIDEAARHLQSQGVRVTGPFDGQRTRPDGSVLRWKMLLPESGESKVPMPFLIQWEQSDEVRRIENRERGLLLPHPRGDLRVRDVSYAVHDLEKTAALWQRWYGFQPKEMYVDEGLRAQCLEFPLAGGGLRLCSPLQQEQAEQRSASVLTTVLQKRQERPFLIRFTGFTGDQQEEVCGGLYHFSY
ncbi:MAG: VOC family protein [Clostridia bacterium]